MKSNLYVRIYDNDHDVLVTFTLLTTCFEWVCCRRRRLVSGLPSVLRIVSCDYRDTLSFIRLFAYSLSSLQEKEVHNFMADTTRNRILCRRYGAPGAVSTLLCRD